MSHALILKKLSKMSIGAEEFSYKTRKWLLFYNFSSKKFREGSAPQATPAVTALIVM